MSYTQRFSEWWDPLLSSHPAGAVRPGTYTSAAYASLQNYHRAVLVLDVGEMQAASTFDAQILQAQDAAGTGAKVIGNKAATGNKAITQLTQAGGDGSQLFAIELQTEELDVDNNFEHVGVQVTAGVNGVEYSYVLYAFEPRFAAVPLTNWDEVID